MAATKTKLTPEEKEKLKQEKAEQKRLDTIKKDIEAATNNVKKLLAKYPKPLIIRNEEELNNYIKAAISNNEITIDTETTGLNVYKDKLVGVCLYTDGQQEAYIPINHVDYTTGIKLDNQLDEGVVKLFLNKLQNTNVIMHNADFDIRVLRRIGVYLKCSWDTMIAATLLDENENHQLKPLHQKYVLKDSMDEFSYGKLFSTKIMTFADIPIEIAAIYAAHDAKITKELKDYQTEVFKNPDLTDVYKVFSDIEIPCIDATCNMEDTGFIFDLEYQKQLEQKYMQLLQEEEDILYENIKTFESKINKWRTTDEATFLEFKPDFIFNIFDGMPKIVVKLLKINGPVEYKVSSNENWYLFAPINHSDVGFKLLKKDVDKKLKEGYVYGKSANGQPKVVKAADLKKWQKIIDTGTYVTSCKKSKADQLPAQIRDIKLSSPTQLAILLYDVLEKNNKLRDTPRSTGVQALKNINDDFSKELLKYRGFKKLIDAFILSLPTYITDDGILHYSLNQVGTVTGRYSSSKPNLQQIPSNNKEIRKLFIAPTNYRDVEDINNIFIFKNTEEIDITGNGNWKFVKDLKVGDKIQDKVVKNITIIDKNIKVEVA